MHPTPAFSPLPTCSTSLFPVFGWDLDSLLLGAGVTIVSERGLSGLTITAVAEHHGVSRQAVQNWLRNHQYTLLDRLALVLFDRWGSWEPERVRVASGLVGLLPDSEDVERWTRLWLALVEQANRPSAVGDQVARALEDERAIIRRWHPEADAMAIQALVIGLRQLRCARPPLVSPEQAAALLTAALPAAGDERSA